MLDAARAWRRLERDERERTRGAMVRPARFGERRRYRVAYVVPARVERFRGRFRRERRRGSGSGRVGVFVPYRHPLVWCIFASIWIAGRNVEEGEEVKRVHMEGTYEDEACG